MVHCNPSTLFFPLEAKVLLFIAKNSVKREEGLPAVDGCSLKMKREKGPGSVVGKLGGTPESPGRPSKRRHPGPTPGAGDEAGASAACLLFFWREWHVTWQCGILVPDQE